MGEPAIFSLGPKGIITAPEELMRMLFMHAFEADHSQSTMHQESVFCIGKHRLPLFVGKPFPVGNPWFKSMRQVDKLLTPDDLPGG